MFYFLIFIFFIFLSSLFSSFETATFSLSKAHLARLKRQLNLSKDEVLFKKPLHLIVVLTFCNMLVNICISSLFTQRFVYFLGDKGLGFAVLFSSIFILIFGEILPKTFAVYLAEKIFLTFFSSIKFLYQLFSPLVIWLEKILDFFSLSNFSKITLQEQDLENVLRLGKRSGHLTQEEFNIAFSLLKFKNIRVKEIMIPRVEIKAININFSVDDLRKFLCETKHSKLPVYKENLDNIVGIFYSKDFFLNISSDYRQFIKSALFVPETQYVDKLLQVFLEKRENIAIVIDEYGGTSGLVCLEDIEEEIFGEFYDEFELPSVFIEEIEKNIYRVYGGTSLKEVKEKLNLDLPEKAETIAGFILSFLSYLPKPQEKFIYKNLEFTIEKASLKRIISIIIKKL